MTHSFFQRKKRGISLVEVMMVIAIIGVLSGIGASGFFLYKRVSDFSLSGEKLVNVLRFAETKARDGVNDDAWGVHVSATEAIIFKGGDFSGRNTIYDEKTDFVGVTSASGLTQIVFSKMSGFPLTSGSVTLSGENQTKVIQINEKGIISE